MTEIVVTGHLRVAPSDRAAYLDGCAEVVALARAAPGCVDFAIGADLVDPGRVNVLERWTGRAELDAFRGNGPSGEQRAALLSVEVVELDVGSS